MDRERIGTSMVEYEKHSALMDDKEYVNLCEEQKQLMERLIEVNNLIEKKKDSITVTISIPKL